MSADKCPVCGTPKDYPSDCNFPCGYIPDMQIGCRLSSRLAIERAAEVERLREILDSFKSMVREFVAEMQDGRPWAHKTDAPGHAHKVPGRWDDDGSECRRCTLWRGIKDAAEKPEKKP